MNKLLSIFIGILISTAALGQAPPNPPAVAVLGGNATLATFGTSSRVALPAPITSYPAVMFINDGANEAFVATGSVSVVATTASTPLPPGNCLVQWAGGGAYVAGITASSTTTLRIIQWNGAPEFSCNSASVNATISGGSISVMGAPSTDGSSTIATGGTPQVLFAGATPSNGFKVSIPASIATLSSFVCFVSDTSTSPSSTTSGAYPVYAGGQYASEPGQKPIGAIYLNCPTTGTVFSAQKW